MKLLSYRYTPTIVFCVYLLPSSRAAEQTSTMSRISDVLIQKLDRLDTNSFKRFKNYLERDRKIPTQTLEKAEVSDVVTLMVDAYGESDCGSVVSDILRKMNKNQLALEVDKELPSGKLLLHSSMLSWLECLRVLRRACILGYYLHNGPFK